MLFRDKSQANDTDSRFIDEKRYNANDDFFSQYSKKCLLNDLARLYIYACLCHRHTVSCQVVLLQLYCSMQVWQLGQL